MTDRATFRRPRAAGDPLALKNRTIGVVGLGLIGGSLLKRLASRHAGPVLGHDANAGLADQAGRVATWCPSVDEIVAASDVLALCVPVPAIVRLLPVIAKACRRRSRRRRLLVTDLGSMKQPVAQTAALWRADFDYVGLHPLAGGEVNGWEASDPGLYDGRNVIVCPTTAASTRQARALVALMGGMAVLMDAAAHDRLAAETIGLPHLLAFAAAGLRPPANQPHPLRGTSWAGLTRVSVSDPAFVAGLLHTNARNQLIALRAFRASLDRLTALLERPDAAPLARALRRAATGK